MKACEPKESEKSHWKEFRTIPPPQGKTYIDYLKESNYPDYYKEYCIDYYQRYIEEYNIFSVIND